MALQTVKDSNELHMADSLPSDPKSGAVPINAAAKRKADEEPRVLTVKQLLGDSVIRTMSTKSRESCTSLHWRLDEMTGGIRPGHVWVFGAETNWGKSSYLVAVADENIQRKRTVLIVSSEDSESIYADRLMARRSRVSASRLRDGKLTPEELSKVNVVASNAENLPVFLDARGKNIESICKQVDVLIKKHAVDLVAFDYLQEFRTSQRYENNERVKFRDIASQMRGVVKDNNIAGMILSQITVQDGKKYPDKHSIRESRDVSNAAEVVALGFTPSEDIPGKDGSHINAGSRCIKIDKAKDGWKGAVMMGWNTESACFEVERRKLTPEEAVAYGLGDEFDQEADWRNQ